MAAAPNGGAVASPPIAIRGGSGASHGSNGLGVPTMERQISCSLNRNIPIRDSTREGYLEKRSKDKTHWNRRWFALRGAELMYCHTRPRRGSISSSLMSPDSAARRHVIPLGEVRSLRTNDDAFEWHLLLRDGREYVLRAESQEELNLWLFGFHQCFVTSVVGNLLRKNSTVESSGSDEGSSESDDDGVGGLEGPAISGAAAGPSAGLLSRSVPAARAVGVSMSLPASRATSNWGGRGSGPAFGQPPFADGGLASGIMFADMPPAQRALMMANVKDNRPGLNRSVSLHTGGVSSGAGVRRGRVDIGGRYQRSTPESSPPPVSRSRHSKYGRSRSSPSSPPLSGSAGRGPRAYPSSALSPGEYYRRSSLTPPDQSLGLLDESDPLEQSDDSALMFQMDDIGPPSHVPPQAPPPLPYRDLDAAPHLGTTSGFANALRHAGTGYGAPHGSMMPPAPRPGLPPPSPPGPQNGGATAAAPPLPRPGAWVSPSARRRMEAERERAGGAGGAGDMAPAVGVTGSDGAASTAAAVPAEAPAPAPAPAAQPGKWVPKWRRKGLKTPSTSPPPSDTGAGSGAGAGSRNGSSDKPSRHHNGHHHRRGRRASMLSRHGAVHGGDAGTRFAVYHAQGNRDHMEDAHVAIEDLRAKYPGEGPWPATCAVFGVYDGHAGRGAAKWASESIARYMCQHPDFHTNPPAAMRSAFERCDEEFLSKWREQPKSKEFSSGSTALSMLLCDRRLHVANLGDCRAVLCRADGRAVALTEDQTPAVEAARIKAAGGWVTNERELLLNKLHNMDLSDPFIRRKAEKSVDWKVTSRLNGDLSVSRAIGDACYKGVAKDEYPWAWPRDHSHVFSGELVLATPVVTTFDLEDTDEFVVMACDGLWDVIETQEAVDLMRTYVIDKHMSPQDACEKLVDMALRLGSTDNVTAMMVDVRRDPSAVRPQGGRTPASDASVASDA